MNVIELRGVHREYKLKGETVKALAGVDLTVTSGEFLVICGPSGAGKTTALNVMGALDVPTEGTALIGGVDLGSLNRTARALLRRDKIGFVFQSYNLIPVLTVLENVTYVMVLQGRSKAERQARAREVLEAVGLGDKLDRRPLELSGGQQQRVAVARALASRPDVILADEPTANLDSKSGNALLDMMQELNDSQGVTFVFSSHDDKVMSRAKRLVTMVDGKVRSDEVKA